MKKLYLFFVLLCSIFLAGCNETKERIFSILTDSDVEENVEFDGTLANQFEDILETTVNEVKEHTPTLDGPNTATVEATNSIVLNQPYAVDGDTLEGQVSKAELEAHGVNITDAMTVLGDQVSVKARYLLIDTPESVHPDKEPQLYSKEAKSRNNELLLSGKVTISFDKGDKVDKYGRLLVYVYVSNTLIQQKLVEEGYARIAYINENNTTQLDTLKSAQALAKEQKLRIWSIDGYVTEYSFSSNVK